MGLFHTNREQEIRQRTQREKKSIAEDFCKHLVQSGRIAHNEFRMFSEHLARQSIEKDRSGQSPFERRLKQLGNLNRVTKFSESFSSVGGQPATVQDIYDKGFNNDDSTIAARAQEEAKLTQALKGIPEDWRTMLVNAFSLLWDNGIQIGAREFMQKEMQV